MNFDLVFECDYGVRSPVKNLLKDLLKKYNANIMPMTALFVNNNPYSLELFVALNFDLENDLLKCEICDKFKSIGNELRTDLCLTDFLNSMGNRQFNFRTLVDEIDCEFAFENSFSFAEKDELKVKNYSNEKIEPIDLVFISYSSQDEEDAEKLVSILNGQSISVWYDKNKIDYGESIIDKIEKATDDCIGVIFYVTNHFLRSGWCKLEKNSFFDRYGSNADILILIIKDKNVERNELPSFFRTLKYIDKVKFDSLEDVVHEIVPTISKHIRKKRARISIKE